MPVIPLLALLACTKVDPELASRRKALDAWERGHAALEARDAAAAEAAFDEAIRARPDDPLLKAWKAKAQADGGRLDDAIGTLDAVLRDHPDFAEARYNRAAWLARAGRPDESALDLQVALEGDVDRSAADVLDDPDFAPYLAHPAFADVIPKHPIAVALEGPTGTVFWGSDFDVRLTAIGVPEGRALDVDIAGSGPARLTSVVEDDAPSTSGPVRLVTFRLVITGVGDVNLGPVSVAAGARTGGTADVVHVIGAAPPGKEPGPVLDAAALESPRALLGAHPVPSAWTSGSYTYVAARAADRVVIEPAAAPFIAYEVRRAGAKDTVITAYPAAPGARVTVGDATFTP